jgi:hypothetical protein
MIQYLYEGIYDYAGKGLNAIWELQQTYGSHVFEYRYVDSNVIMLANIPNQDLTMVVYKPDGPRAISQLHPISYYALLAAPNLAANALTNNSSKFSPLADAVEKIDSNAGLKIASTMLQQEMLVNDLLPGDNAAPLAQNPTFNTAYVVFIYNNTPMF